MGRSLAGRVRPSGPEIERPRARAVLARPAHPPANRMRSVASQRPEVPL